MQEPYYNQEIVDEMIRASLEDTLIPTPQSDEDRLSALREEAKQLTNTN